MTARRSTALLLTVVLGLGGCSSSDQTDGSTSSDARASTTPSASPPTKSANSSPWAGLAEQRPSLADYFDQLPVTSGLRLGRVREHASAYTSYDVSYRVDGLQITGVLNVPRGPGPFPAVVLAHGWIDRDIYDRGQGMTRERGYLAELGYVALHVDYRNHAESEDDPRSSTTSISATPSTRSEPWLLFAPPTSQWSTTRSP